MKMDDVLTTVHGREITVEHVLARLKANGVFRRTIYELIEYHVVNLKLAELGIEVGDEEFLRRREQKKLMMGLSDPIALKNYKTTNGLNGESLDAYIEHLMKRDILREIVVTDEMISSAFDRERDRFSTATLSRIVCGSKKEAKKAVREAQGSVADFPSLAKEFSNDKQACYNGGYLGEIRRGVLPGDIESEIFASAPDSVVGPYQEGGHWTVYKVCAVHEPELNANLRAFLVDQIFNEWLRHQVNTVLA